MRRKKEVSHNQIVKELGRSQSTIFREIHRNTGLRGYRHKQAGNFASKRHIDKPKYVKLTDEVKYLITVCLQRKWSPEQIAGRLRDEYLVKLHHETVYQFVLTDKSNGGELYRHLRHQEKTYRKRYGSSHNRTGIPGRIDIDQRLEIANNRERIGDWEADTIIGENHERAIVTLNERKSKLRLAAPLPKKRAKAVQEAIISLFTPIKKFVKTVTFDMGRNSHCTKMLPKSWTVRHILPNHTILGREVRMKMLMACYANTFRRLWGWWM